VISPAAGIYNNFPALTINTATTGATTFYTTDGSDTATSPTAIKYNGATPFTAGATITAVAELTGMNNSAESNAAFVFTAATPVIAPAAGSYDNFPNLTITTATTGATIFYTTDGSDPATSPTAIQYSGPTPFTASATITAVAKLTGMNNSAESNAAFVFTAATPVFSPLGGTCLSPQNVSITCATAGAAIYYTTDSSTPTTSSPQYSTPLNLASTTTLTAYAVIAGMANSAAASATYTFVAPAITSALSAAATENSTYSYLIAASGSTPITYTASNLPGGLSQSGGTISGTPTVAGITEITLTATNTTGSDTEILLLTIAPPGNATPLEPTIDSPVTTPTPVVAGQPVTFSVSASDPGVSLLLYTWTFGDQTSGVGATVNHIYTAPGIYTATVTISNGANFTSQSVTVIIDAAGGSVDPSQFSVTKHAFSFNFSKPASDSMSLSGTLPVASGYNLSNKSLNVIIGGYTSSFTLTAKGQGSTPTDSIKFTGSIKNGVCAKSPLKFSYAVKKQNLLALLAQYGFSTANASKQSISLPVLMDLDNAGYLANITVSYTAKSGKSGTAK